MRATAPLQTNSVKAEQSNPSLGGRLLQRKLTVGASNDPLEKEADEVAERVLATPQHSAIGSAGERIQRLSGQPTGQSDTAPASVDKVLASPGRPLEPALRQDMERRFGFDFSQVRVHSGAAAEQSAHDLNATAFTVGHNIVFDVGRYPPETREGRRLIAHELAHVVQQSNWSARTTGDQTSGKRGLSPNSSNSSSNSSLSLNSFPSSLLVQRKPKYVGTRMGFFTTPEAREYLEGIIWMFLFDASQLKEKQNVEHPERFPLEPRDSLSMSLTWLNNARMVLYEELKGDATFASRLRKAYQAAIYWKLRRTAEQQSRSAYEIYIEYNDVIDPWAARPGPATNVQVPASPEPVSSRSLEELTKIAPAPQGAPFNRPPDAPERPPETSLSEIAAARARAMMLEHRKSIAETGVGTYVGSAYSPALGEQPVPSGVQKIGCTDYIRWVLGYALWAKNQPRGIAYAGGNITDLIKELVTKKGWKAVAFAPNSAVMIRKSIPFKEYLARGGTYEGVPIDLTMSIIDYVNNPAEEIKERLNRLRHVPLAILGAHHGTHAAFIIHGEVYEVHYSLGPADPRVFEATPFDQWHGIWVREHGVLAMPPESWSFFVGTGS